MHALEPIINAAFEKRDLLTPSTVTTEYKNAITETLAGLSNGRIRVAEKINNNWVINQWAKRAILLQFRISDFRVFNAGDLSFYDKVALKYSGCSEAEFKQHQVRVVPPAVVREGVYVAPNCVLMPSYINIGAYIDSGSMIDIWATIGSCAQIGKNVHISSNTCIGGVLEPLQANPVIIEDNCFIGTGAAIVEGVIVEENSIIGMGVKIGQSTKIYDRTRDELISGRVPAGSVVIPGSIPSSNGKYNTDCAIIIKTVDSTTRAKVSINQLLRETTDA
jgi:2,3,4,5-tetrahydropyridine-2-carboxylate N-succinyltransferase